ncbi:MAG: acetolactate synthase large subunit [Gemmatimonadota bacterium]
MNGARRLLKTLLDSGVEVCFTNPGTSEMHFVAALDSEPGMRAILGLFEGVVTGAADGYARMAEKPACTLLHLGPGLGNGLANLHNARRARVPVVNIVGDHATHHRALDAPLTSDIRSIASAVSGWVHSAGDPAQVAQDGARAVAASYGPPGQVATLILPADTAWLEAGPAADPVRPPGPKPLPPERVQEIAELLRSAGDGAAILLNGSALYHGGTKLAGKIAAATGARLFTDTFVRRAERGAGRVNISRLPYLGERAVEALRGVTRLITVETKAPVSFFAYPGKPGELIPEGCTVHTLADPAADGREALRSLVEALDADSASPSTTSLDRPGLPTGDLTPETLALVLAHHLPENAVVMNEAATAGRAVPGALRDAPPHDWLDLTGGAIGQGMPAATGAAVACPDRKVVSLEADGSGMYTVQALWTQAREGLDVTTVIFSNRKYAILEMEYRRVGAGDPSPRARGLFDLTRPELDWVEMAASMGVEGARATTAEELADALARGLAEPGPYLVEAVL